MASGCLLSCCQEGGFSGIVPFTPTSTRSGHAPLGVGTVNGATRVAALVAPLLVGGLVAAGPLYLLFVIFAAC